MVVFRAQAATPRSGLATRNLTCSDAAGLRLRGGLPGDAIAPLSLNGYAPRPSGPGWRSSAAGS